ncbi:murein hydrolase activator EnvC family protein [Sphingomonas mesophila]|uniref:murein hydrolase activator EnvC family protein n=1 Tax=Sphingomonas mesophila TaxID=2303576 RepID=UPI000E5769D6|nr:peptidoglycan DD-metalloendopeptidase family protein [Sphingomonas mesophila]
MARRLFLAAVLGLAAGSSVAASPVAVLQAEYRAAEAETRRLEAAAARAGGEAARLALERQAAAAAIGAAEARISVAAGQLADRRRAVAAAQARLAERQRPLAALVAGLIQLERRPPLLAIADRGSVEELMRTRTLLAAALPEVRRRSAAVAAELRSARALAAAAARGEQQLQSARAELRKRQQRFAELEQAALTRAQSLGGAALEAGDSAIVAGIGAESAASEGARAAQSRRIAARLAQLPPAPARPVPPEGTAPAAMLPYALPASAAVSEGEGAIGDTGVRARGIRLETRRGTPLVMPADGTIAFSGPFRRHDGVVILDHGGGWMTMLVGARAEASRGTRLKQGAPLGVALGPVALELSRNGRHISPALAAQRSRSLSIQPRRR